MSIHLAYPFPCMSGIASAAVMIQFSLIRLKVECFCVNLRKEI